MLVVIAMCFALFLVPYDAIATQSVGLTIVAFASAILMILSFEDRRIREFLSKPALVFTGKISYGWYLWHYPLIILASFYVNKHTAIGVLVLAASITLSYAAAVGSYFLIEMPFLRLKKKYSAEEIAPARTLAVTMPIY